MAEADRNATRRALSVEPEARRFSSTQEDALQRKLREVEQTSVFYPVNSDRELALDQYGRTQLGGSRFTHWAFFQLCQTVSPGLFRLVMDLSGEQRSSEQPRADYSFEEAVAMLNLLIRRRFSTKLYGKNLLRDRETNVIHGIVGANYRWLPNKDLYDRTVATVRSSRAPMCFHEAILNGRWLLLRFRQTRPFFEFDVGDFHDAYYGGFHFSNNEVGVAAVRAAAVLLRAETGTAALTPPVRLIHSTRRGFDQRLELLLASVGDRLRSPEFYRGRERLARGG
jgi:hypothetical protein